MSIKDFILRLRAELRTWVAAYAGSAEIAGDTVDLFGLLALKPGSVRVVIWIPREGKRGEFEESGMVDRELQIFVSRGRGFAALATDSLIRETAGAGKPLYDLVEEVRELVRAMDLPADTTESTPDYKGFEPFSLPTDRAVDAYQLRFSLGIQLPAAGRHIVWDANDNPIVVDNDNNLMAA